MSAAIQVRSFQQIRAEVERLKDALVADAVNALDICYEARDHARARGDEATAWKVCQEAAAMVAANRAARASLDRFVEHLEQAEQS
jgi:hypothetical protein